MPFAIYCVDKPNSGELRQTTRPAHLAYLESFKAKLLLAGPLLADDATTPCGSLLVVDFADKEAAQDFAAGDPFAKAGLFGEVSIRPFRKTLP
jgi:uncharacterized protein YciI